MKKSLYLIIAAIVMSASAWAQQIQVSTGDPKGSTYVSMFKDTGKYCGNSVALVDIPSSGSVENLERLVTNKVNAAFVQSDMLYLRARTEDLGHIKTLLALHPEQVHFVAPVSSGMKQGGKLGTSIGATEVVVSDITQLAGLKVGAAGGSVITASIIKLQSDVPYQVVEFADAAALKAALAAGQVQAAVFVGGAPLKSVDDLGAGYKLLSINEATLAKLTGVYRPAKANYPSLKAAGVPTVSTDALLVVREYKTAKMVEAMSKLRACVLANLDEIKETTGTHPAWQRVRGDNKGLWAYYELPATVAPAPAGKK